MEQSTKAVESQTQAPENQQAIAVPPQAPASTFTKVDNNLTGIGFFTASSKRSRKEIEKTTVITDQGIERRISILPSAKYGLPITQDQDYWLALMKLVAEHLQREGKLVNPFSFTTAGLTKILGQAHSGKNYKAVQEWADVMAFTGIKGGAYDAVKKRWLTDRTHAVERFVNIGRELPDGRIAEKNYVWFSQWQLDNINAGNLIAIELTTYIQLENNIAKNLVPHLQEWLFASQRDGRFEKQYEDLCQLLGIRTYHYHSDIHRQLAPSFDELLSHGYLSKWAIDTMANRHSYKLVLWHGSKYHSDRHTRLEQKQRIKTIPSGDATDPSPAAGQSTTPAHRPRQRRLKLSPVAEPSASPAVVIDYRLVAELGKRGVGEIDARQLLASLPPGRPLLDQLEWGDIQIEQSRGKITNPPGFYISLLQRNVPLPSTFESSATRIARQQRPSRSSARPPKRPKTLPAGKPRRSWPACHPKLTKPYLTRPRPKSSTNTPLWPSRKTPAPSTRAPFVPGCVTCSKTAGAFTRPQILSSVKPTAYKNLCRDQQNRGAYNPWPAGHSLSHRQPCSTSKACWPPRNYRHRVSRPPATGSTTTPSAGSRPRQPSPPWT